jgi:Zn-dependent peptidase ImmA (M78 family)
MAHFSKELRDEKEARCFASAFLLPRKLVAQCRTAEEVSEKFGVSLEAALIRLKEIKRDEQEGQMRQLPRSILELFRQAQKRGPGME